MSPVLVQRQLSLVAVAMVGVVVALAVASRTDDTPEPTSRLPKPAVSELSGWYTALAGVRRRPLAGRPSGCGTLLAPKTLGVDHSVLPCGTKVFVAYRGRTVLTNVVDRGPFGPGREFEITPALAELLRFKGVKAIRWSFARPG